MTVIKVYNSNTKNYVYRFIDQENVVVYVGRSTNLKDTLATHPYLDESIRSVEYIHCSTVGDMMWKVIYYTNLFYNSKSRNKTNLYDGVTDLHLKETWLRYNANIDDFNIKDAKMKVDFMRSLPRSNYKELIHILDNSKMNHIGADKFALTQAWFNERNTEFSTIDQISKNFSNYFMNILKAKSSECLWTTYASAKKYFRHKGFVKGYVSNKDLLDSSTFNRKYLAYACNHFFPVVKDNMNFTEEEYALAELLYFIWRSAIRDGEEIYIYIPSIRMRTLLQNWIEENSVMSVANEASKEVNVSGNNQ